MASGSVKDVVRTLENAFATQKSPMQEDGFAGSKPLPEEVQKAILSFLDKSSALEDADSQRLHEELLSIRKKHVAADNGKLGEFLHALQLLRPAIRGKSRLLEWWNSTILPILDATGHRRAEIDHATAFVLGVLDYDSDNDAHGEAARLSAEFAQIVLEVYIKRMRIPQVDTEPLTSEDGVIAHQLEQVLVAYGRKKPKEFLLAVDRLVVYKVHRLQALSLLCTFVRYQPPHLYLISQTPLVEHLLKCLMIDTSTTVISLALTTLIMFLPHIPTSVRTHLPRLFLIYSRLLCWERFSPSNAGEENDFESENEELSQNGAAAEHEQSSPDEEAWEKLTSSFEIAESTAPELVQYYTFLYGLYPLNFTSYIRKPRKYLKAINFPRAEEFDLDQGLIRSRSDQFRRVHLLHPNFFNSTEEDELTNNRWMKSDAADVVSECMSLCITPASNLGDARSIPESEHLHMPSSYVQTEDIPAQSLLEKDDISVAPGPDTPTTEDLGATSAIRDSKISIATPRSALTSTEPYSVFLKTSVAPQDTPSTQSPVFGSPIIQPRDTTISSPAFPPAPSQRSTASNLLGSTASVTTASDQSPRLAPPTRDELPRSPAIRPALPAEANMAFLQREVMLLRSELNFERYLKDQHLTHIGQLQRRRIKELTVEAETQNLINANRALKARVAKANESYAALKKETATRWNQSKKWEAELTARVKTLKDEEKQLRAEEESLRLELSKAQQDCDHLRQIVVDSESRELLGRQDLISMQRQLEEVDSLRLRVTQLEEQLREFDEKELQYQESAAEKEAMKEELIAAGFLIESKDASLAQTQSCFDHRVRSLEAQLAEAQNPAVGGPPGRVAPHIQRLLDDAVASTESKYDTLASEHADLKRRFFDLEIRCKELENTPKEFATADKSIQSGMDLSLTASAPEVRVGTQNTLLKDARLGKKSGLAKLAMTSSNSSANTSGSGNFTDARETQASSYPHRSGYSRLVLDEPSTRPTTSPSIQEALDDVFAASAATHTGAAPVAVPSSGRAVQSRPFTPGSLPATASSMSPVASRTAAISTSLDQTTGNVGDDVNLASTGSFLSNASDSPQQGEDVKSMSAWSTDSEDEVADNKNANKSGGRIRGFGRSKEKNEDSNGSKKVSFKKRFGIL